MVASREAGTLYDAVPSNKSSCHADVPDGVATTTACRRRCPTADNPPAIASGGQYVIHREAGLTTPYLPDGAAGGVALRAQPGHTLPGVAAEMVLGPSVAVLARPRRSSSSWSPKADWPDTKGFRIVRRAQGLTTKCPATRSSPMPAPPQWDEAERG